MAGPRAEGRVFQFAVGGRFARAKKIASGILGLALFVLALQLLKASAGGLGALVVGIGVDSAWGSLGFGWALAYIVLSGSPVAAIALAFFASDILTAVETFTMIAGSRFGASFVVLLLGFIYMIRGRESRGRSLEMGVLSLLTTYVVYGIAVPLGVFALMSGLFDGFYPSLPPALFDVISLVFDPLIEWSTAHLHPLLIFIAGIGTILVAFALFDAALPDLAEESPIRGLEAHVYRPVIMFALGCAITFFTLSVSVSLGLLVPLSAKGIARRENVIPYIMGANITTFVDTLLATLLLGRPEAFTIVLVEMISVAAVSAVFLLFFYGWFERTLLGASKRILATRTSLTIFVVTILVLPIILLML